MTGGRPTARSTRACASGTRTFAAPTSTGHAPSTSTSWASPSSREQRAVPGWGTVGDTLFVAAGDYHHHLGFNTWKSAGGPPQPDGVAGLHHVAILYPTQAALADALLRLRAANWPLRVTIDHGTHLALYLSDPDGNGLELAWDRPREQWPHTADGTPSFDHAVPVDLDALTVHAPAGAPQ